MSEFVGEPEGAWRLQCTLSLASCRLRAESLARRLHSKLWAAGRYEGSSGLYGINGVYDRCRENDQRESGTQGKVTYGANEGFVNGHCWRNAATAMFAAATVNNSTSLDGEEYYDCEGRLSSPPSPADDEEIIVNPPVGLPPVPGLKSLRGIIDEDNDDEEVYGEPEEDYDEPEECAMLTQINRPSNKMVTSNEILFEKLILIADSLNMTADDDEVQLEDSIQCNGVGSSVQFKTEKVFTVLPDATVNGDSLETESIATESTNNNFDTVNLTESTSESSSPSIVISKFKFSVTPVVEATPAPQTDSPESETESSFKSAISADSIASLTLDGPSSFFHDEDDDEDDIFRRKLLLRSTSLKSGKTPPGTPRRKKIVRFADALGLDLEAVRHIVNDDLPNIPASAFTDLKLSENLDKLNLSVYASSHRTPTVVNNRVLYPQFSQPVTDPYFLERVRTQRVSLENIVVSGLSVYGVIRVLNVSFEKTVLVRYTTDEWRTFYEVPSSYVPDSHDGFSDRFRFTLHQPGLSAGQRLVMAVRYITPGAESWDNNYGENYIVRCHLTSSASSPSSEGIYSFM